MNLTQPKTLHELAADGLFTATAHDMCWQQFKGVRGIEFNFQAEASVDAAANSKSTKSLPLLEDVPVEVRLYTEAGTIDFAGRRIAVLADATWTWATAIERSADIAELHGSHPPSEIILAAARTLEGGNTILIGDQENGTKAVVSVDITQADPSKSGLNLLSPQAVRAEKVLVEGIGDPLIGELDELRAVRAFAHNRGLGIEELSHGLRLRNAEAGSHNSDTDITVEFLDERISAIFAPQGQGSTWRLEDISADGYFCAIEHAMWLSANFPKAANEHVPVNLEAGRVLVDEESKLEASAVIIATVTDGMFTWAWADSQLAQLRWQAPVQRLRKFGIDKLVPALVRQSIPADTARELALPQAAMPIMNMWKVVTVRLNPHTTGIVLIDAPELQLPPLSPEVEASVLENSPPIHINSNRAFEAYEAMRGSQRLAPSTATTEANQHQR